MEDNDEGLQCDACCDKWHHTSCGNVNNEQYDMIRYFEDISKRICEILVYAVKLEPMRTRVIGAGDYINLREMVGQL